MSMSDTEKCTKCGIDHQGVFCPMESVYEIEHMPMIRTIKSIVAEALAARDKRWVEWGKKPCYKHFPGRNRIDRLYKEHRKDCEFCWQERKRSVGL